MEQWEPLLSYFLQEVRKVPLEISKATKNAESSHVPQKRKATNTDEISKPKKLKTSEVSKTISKNDKMPEKQVKRQLMHITREDKIFYFLSSEMNKA